MAQFTSLLFLVGGEKVFIVWCWRNLKKAFFVENTESVVFMGMLIIIEMNFLYLSIYMNASLPDYIHRVEKHYIYIYHYIQRPRTSKSREKQRKALREGSPSNHSQKPEAHRLRQPRPIQPRVHGCSTTEPQGAQGRQSKNYIHLFSQLSDYIRQ